MRRYDSMTCDGKNLVYWSFALHLMKSTLERLEKEKLVQDRAQVYEQRIHHQQYQQLKWAVEVTFLICFRMRGVPRKGGGSLRKEGGGPRSVGWSVGQSVPQSVSRYVGRQAGRLFLH